VRRLPPVSGELIDRGAPIEFEFEGRSAHGFRGDTISSALAAEGVRIMGRSFKYHRPRGLLSAADHDVNALMQVRAGGRSVPNVRADVVPLQAGWRISAVNTRGGLARDRLAALGWLAPFLPVGFYYKAFHSKRLFPRWERMFRRLTGLGTVDLTAARRSTPKRYDFCDVLVIGAGPSGLAAALAAAERGAGVLLVDENQLPGGSGLYARGGASTPAALAQLIQAVGAHPRIRLQLGAYAAGYYADHWVALVRPDCMVKVRARSVIVAQGAYEQPAVFRGNDLPGVMLASAAQRLLYRYAVAPARRIAVLTSNAQGYAAALDGLAHGIQLAAVLDLRSAAGALSRPAAEELARRSVPVHYGVRPIEARALAGGELGSLEFECSGGPLAGRQRLTLDGLWMSVGFAPANALLHQANAGMAYVDAVEQFVPQTLPAGVYACGKVNGVYGLAERLADGGDAGARAAGGLGFGGESPRCTPPPQQESPTHPYPVFEHPRGLEFVDFDEDLQLKDLHNACQEGFDSSELLKRFSTLGMGPSQGKHSSMNGLRILARIRGEPIERLGTTTARPMFHPVPLAHLAGRGFMPERRTPLDAEHSALGAVWMPAGNWRRPEYYALAGKSREQAIADEVRAVRTRVGLIDVGTLGKIEIHGTQAAEFLERVYTGRFANLRPGMTRYGLMLDESGTVIDDGVIGRLAADSFYFTTTTGNSATLFREFGRLATWWGLSVGLVNLTGHYAAFNLAGPAARALLREHTSLDLSDAAFPYLGMREALVAGVPCRIMRVGFVGELGYELHLGADYACALWRALLASGARYQIQVFGVEAQRMLRLEKGHLIVGQDTDGVTNALEIDVPWALKLDKPFFVGQRSLRILASQPRRQTLVGFSLPGESARRPKECHLVIEDGRIAGRVTSVGYSPTLSRCIGLALVSPRQAELTHLRIRIEAGEELLAERVRPPFYDAGGERQHVDEAAWPAAAAARAAPALAAERGWALQRWWSELASGRQARAGAGLRFEAAPLRERFGCKGPGAPAWLEAAGFTLPQAANSARVDAGGVLVARLASSEFLIEAVDGGAAEVAACRARLGAPTRPAQLYPVARHDLALQISGGPLNALLRQICSVDFAGLIETCEPDAARITLTSMIGVAVVAALRRRAQQPVLTLWIDPSFAYYFCSTLLAVADELGGVTIDAADDQSTTRAMSHALTGSDT
jgi:sarcosine oxidase subunit alpha